MNTPESTYTLTLANDGNLFRNRTTVHALRIAVELYNALDVTSMAPDGDTVDSTWWMSYTSKRLTPLTLFKHMLPQTVDRETWTCSGIVEALLGASRIRAYLKPQSPDQLYHHYKEQ